MKRIIAFFIAAVLCVSLIACSDKNKPTAPMGMQFAADPEITDYNLMVPDDWTIETSTGTTTAYYKDSLSGAVMATFTASFNVPESSAITLDNYFDTYAASFEQFFERESITESDITLDGIPAKQYIYTMKYGDTECKFWQVVCFNKNIIYTLTYSSTLEYYDKYEEDMFLILDNFSFKK